MADPPYIPVYTGASGSSASSAAGSAPHATHHKKRGGGGGGGGGGGNPYLAAQHKAQSKAAKRYLEEAKSMQGQIKALRWSLSEGFKSALSKRLANINLVSGQQDQALLDSYGNRVKQLGGAAQDNERALGQQQFAALSNRGRERANALSEIAAQGAGETDLLRAQAMSLRNWNANAGEGTRSYFDTLRSVNSSLGDLTEDTKTARINNAAQANADRDNVYSQYYAQRSETFTQLGNVLGQQGEYYGLANEQIGRKRTRRLRRRARRQSNRAFMNAAHTNAEVYDNPGVGAGLMDWKGADEFKGYSGASVLASPDAAEPVNLARPEGATLRSWA